MISERPTFFETIGTWASADHEISVEAIENAKRGIVDVLGVTLAAHGEPLAHALRSIYGSGSLEAGSTVIGQGVLTTPQLAAGWNGSLAHALDFDDSSSDLGGHPSAVVFPAAFAVAEAQKASGRDLLEAYVMGVEVAAALGRALNPSHYDSGWHPTSTLGAFGATVAAGRLLRLDANQLAQAMGLTAALCSGFKASFGTLAKAIQVGRAAMNGVTASQMVQAGVDAHVNAFEHSQGFLRVFQRTDEVPPISLPTSDPTSWSLAIPGLIIKQYPCCGSTHSAADAAMELHRRVAGKDIANITIGLHPKRLAHVNRPDPLSGLDAKFSVQYVVARILLDGELRLNHFADDAVGESQIRELMSRITTVPLDVPDRVVEDRYVAEVTAATSAEVFHAKVPMAQGRQRGSTLPDAAIFSKFADCCSQVLDTACQGRLRESVMALHTLTDVGALSDLVRVDS